MEIHIKLIEVRERFTFQRQTYTHHAGSINHIRAELISQLISLLTNRKQVIYFDN